MEILDIWHEYEDTYATVKTSKGIFTVLKRRVSYEIEGTWEKLEVVPARLDQRYICATWKASENLKDIYESDSKTGVLLHAIEVKLDVDIFELVDKLEKKEKE